MYEARREAPPTRRRSPFPLCPLAADLQPNIPMIFDRQAPPTRPVASFFRTLCLLAILCAAFIADEAIAAQVKLANLSQTYTGSPKSVTVTTTPAGLNSIVTYGPALSTTPPIAVGSYAVVATIVDPIETGAAIGTLVITKANQTVTFGPLTPKTYGDAPFTVTASASTGLAITKWESSDPTVATISQSGVVTLLGAGQTSLIASQSGDSSYNLAWKAQPLMVALSFASPPPGPTTVTYDGNAQGLDLEALPSGQATEITYRDTTAAEATSPAEVVFKNGPDVLDLSYLSIGMQAVGYWGMAKYVDLGGTARKLESCDVTLVNWARYDSSLTYGYLSWANAHPELVVPPSPGVSVPGNSGGYYHPVTLAFYDYVNTGTVESYRLLTTQTVQAFIPWRPATLADGVTPYPHSGCAFRVPFSFPDGIILPQQVWVAVSFNTNTYGTAPIGASGPYESLNIAKLPIPASAAGPLVGTTLLANYTLFHKDWRWQAASDSAGPMLRIRAVPTTATVAMPINAGTYEVKTKPTGFRLDSRSVSTLEVQKALMEIHLADLTQVRDGTSKPVTVTTEPAGIATTVTYGSGEWPDAPSGLGSFPVTAISADPNYVGQATGVLQIGDTFTSWQTAAFAASSLDENETAGPADPDGDGLCNSLEYALNLNPLVGDSSGLVFEHDGGTLGLTYRRNMNALDLDYSLEATSDLTLPSSWKLATPMAESILSDDGSTRVIQATFDKPSGQSRYFLRLKTGR